MSERWRMECEMYCLGGEYAHEWHECVFACEHRVWENCKSIPACAHGHFYNPFDGVCISLRVSLSSHVRMCTCLRLRAFWSAAPPRPLRMCPCMCACVLCVCACACAYVFQESQWLDSVSLLIKDTLEGEMLMIDNLSGSVFHHYSSPQLICKDCKGHPQEVPP